MARPKRKNNKASGKGKGEKRSRPRRKNPPLKAKGRNVRNQGTNKSKPGRSKLVKASKLSVARLKADIVASARAKRGKMVDSKKPVKPLKPFGMFFRDIVAVVMQKYPNKTSVEIKAIIKFMWRNVDPEIKEEYRRRSAVEWANYEVNLNLWEQTDDPEVLKERREKGPLRFLNKYIIFVTDHYRLVQRRHPNLGFGQINQALACMWAKMNNRKKIPYEELGNNENLRWREEMTAYVRGEYQRPKQPPLKRRTAHNGAPEMCFCVPKRKGKRRPLTREEMEMKLKRPRGVTTGYGFFVSDNYVMVRKENPNMTFFQALTRLGCIWTTMTRDQRQSFHKRSLADLERWKTEMALFEKGLFAPRMKPERKRARRNPDVEMDQKKGNAMVEKEAAEGGRETDVVYRIEEIIVDEARKPVDRTRMLKKNEQEEIKENGKVERKKVDKKRKGKQGKGEAEEQEEEDQEDKDDKKKEKKKGKDEDEDEEDKREDKENNAEEGEQREQDYDKGEQDQQEKEEKEGKDQQEDRLEQEEEDQRGGKQDQKGEEAKEQEWYNYQEAYGSTQQPKDKNLTDEREILDEECGKADEVIGRDQLGKDEDKYQERLHIALQTRIVEPTDEENVLDYEPILGGSTGKNVEDICTITQMEEKVKEDNTEDSKQQLEQPDIDYNDTETYMKGAANEDTCLGWKYFFWNVGPSGKIIKRKSRLTDGEMKEGKSSETAANEMVNVLPKEARSASPNISPTQDDMTRRCPCSDSCVSASSPVRPVPLTDQCETSEYFDQQGKLTDEEIKKLLDEVCGQRMA